MLDNPIFDRAERESIIRMKLEDYEALKGEFESLQYELSDLSRKFLDPGVNIRIVYGYRGGYADTITVSANDEQLEEVKANIENHITKRCERYLKSDEGKRHKRGKDGRLKGDD